MSELYIFTGSVTLLFGGALTREHSYVAAGIALMWVGFAL